MLSFIFTDVASYNHPWVLQGLTLQLRVGMFSRSGYLGHHLLIAYLFPYPPA